MKKFTLLAAMLFITSLLPAQTQPAPKPGYSGDTFFGTLQSGNDETGEIVLIADNGGKQETFTGVLKNFKINLPDGSKKELRPSDFPKDSKLVVTFKKKKFDDGPKKGEQYNEVKDVQMAQ